MDRINAIEFRDVDVEYDSIKIIDDFTYAFEKGKRYCIMGESGIGKTTLFNVIMGIKKVDAGSVIYSDEAKENISAVFQEDCLIEELSGIKNVAIAAGIPAGEARLALERVMSAEEAKKKVSDMSGGMKRRVAIVRAMEKKSAVLVMDEPLTGLDTDTKEKVIKYIKEHMNNRTFILISHSKEEAKLFDTQICLLTKGIQVATIEKVTNFSI